MKRRTSATEGVSASLDSFMDIITNTLGLLILIACLTVISGQHVKISLGTPIPKPAPEGLEGVHFECRGNRVMPVDDEFWRKDYGAVDGSDDADKNRMAEEYNRRNVSNEYHRFRLRWRREKTEKGLVQEWLEMVLEPVDGPVGETVSDLRKPDSDFLERLAGLDPDKSYVSFYVREDSFEAFRLARELAREKGFRVGWIPQESSKPVAFSTAGRKIKIPET